MYKFAGVTLDVNDDRGGLLREKYPSLDDVPDVVKTANLKAPEDMRNEDFALVAVDSGHVMRKYACHDPGSTFLSLMYFNEYGDRLPDEARSQAVGRLKTASKKFGLEKEAQAVLGSFDGGLENLALVDITGRAATPKVKVAAPVDDEDYAYVSGEVRKYPIHDWDHIKVAENYWMDYRGSMDPSVRRQFAVKLASKADKTGVIIHDQIKQAAAPDYADEDVLQDGIDLRMLAVQDDEKVAELSDIYDAREWIEAEKYASLLERFDVENGLADDWDHHIPDPYRSTFGHTKIANVVWQSGVDRLTEDDLVRIVAERSGELAELIAAEQDWSKAEKNPKKWFDGLPPYYKRIIARLATDYSGQGASSSQMAIADFAEKKAGMQGFIDSMAKKSGKVQAEMAERMHNSTMSKAKGAPGGLFGRDSAWREKAFTATKQTGRRAKGGVGNDRDVMRTSDELDALYKDRGF